MNGMVDHSLSFHSPSLPSPFGEGLMGRREPSRRTDPISIHYTLFPVPLPVQILVLGSWTGNHLMDPESLSRIHLHSLHFIVGGSWPRTSPKLLPILGQRTALR